MANSKAKMILDPSMRSDKVTAEIENRVAMKACQASSRLHYRISMKEVSADAAASLSHHALLS